MRTRWLAATAVALLSGALGLLANPVMSHGVHAVQVPRSRHVQVTYFCEGESCQWAPPTATRDGQELRDVAWKTAAIRTNSGSGVEGFTAYQFCDCTLPVGPHGYVLRATLPDHRGSTLKWDYTLDVTVVDPAAPPAPPPPADARSAEREKRFKALAAAGKLRGSMEPEPAWPQGVDCTAWCQRR